MNRIALLSLFVLMQYVCFSKDCNDVPINDMILRGKIGGGDSLLVKNQWLPCSKILVEAETVAEIEEGTVLGFVHPDPENKIYVDGTLIINGRKKNPVIFSGYLDNSARSDTSGEHGWGGIVINNGGKLIVHGANFYGAKIPISGYSTDIELRESFFKNGEKVLLFSHRSYSIDSSGYIDSLLVAQYVNQPVANPAPANSENSGEKAGYKMGLKIPKSVLALLAGSAILGGSVYGISAWIKANRPTAEERFLTRRPRLPEVAE